MNWYHEKARECGRRAALSHDLLVREGHLRDEKNWQAIADRIVATEAALKIKGVK
jgi:hypothetical protein